MLNIDKTLNVHVPYRQQGLAVEFRPIMRVLDRILHVDEIKHFVSTHQHLRNFSFLNALMEYFDISYRISAKQRAYIPAEGRLIIIANHPIGTIDALALLKLLNSVRPDVKVIAKNLCNLVQPLDDLFLCLGDEDHSLSAKRALFVKANQVLDHEGALIIFPAQSVSSIGPTGVKDGAWHALFLKLAARSQAPILPILVNSRNSAIFYGLSAIYRPLGSFLLIDEMFRKKHTEIDFRIGKPIPHKSWAALQLSKKKLVKRFKKHLYRLQKSSKKPKNLFDTVTTIVHPVDKKCIKQELQSSPLLGKTTDEKYIYLFDYGPDSAVMQEIGRLRELAFRAVGEGTGKSLDIDVYDRDYRHLILWDKDELEIAGAYRLAECNRVLQQRGIDGLYTSSLFELSPRLQGLLPDAVELGRSFVQPKYWGRRSLDYLWFGIGVYLNANPHIKYFFGPVSLSDSYPPACQQLIVDFYRSHFAPDAPLATAREPFRERPAESLRPAYNGDYRHDFAKLTQALGSQGVKVPTLYKQYTELCDEGGIQFLDFNIDRQFNNCIDSLIWVDISRIRDSKKKRYIHDNALLGKTSSAA